MEGEALIRGLEERCFNAWPALRTVLVDGWVLRLSDGHTKRSNSASALYPSSLSVPELARDVARLFREQGLRPIIRVTPLAPQGCADDLRALGWVDEDPTLCLVAPDITSVATPPDALIEAVASDRWIDGAMEAYGHGAKGASSLRRMLPLIAPARAFITIRHEGRDAAWGLAVMERGMVGLYDLVVAPQARGAGLGRKLVSTLLDWGAREGATTAYLQVREANRAALRLYESFGFRAAYRYGNYCLAR